MKLVKAEEVMKQPRKYKVYLEFENKLIECYNTYIFSGCLFVEYFHPIEHKIKTKKFNKEDYINVK